MLPSRIALAAADRNDKDVFGVALIERTRLSAAHKDKRDPDMHIVPFSQASSADLTIDAVYRGDRRGNAGDDPLPLLLKVSNSGGFRYRGQVNALKLVVLTSSGKDPDWPDTLDRETGTYVYYGDNKRPGRGLDATPRKGNKLLERIFELALSGIEGRKRVPPIFLFANTGEWRDVSFLGLAVPGNAGLLTSEDLVALWRIAEGRRFQNYRARLTVLDVPSISRTWINDIIAGNPRSKSAPTAWMDWVKSGRPRTLRATRSLEYRTKLEQLPESRKDRAILKAIHGYFKRDFHAFERCAGALARLLLPDIAAMDFTRPSRDGGRDATGTLRIGSGHSGILVDFALEAKCFDTSTAVTVRHMSRLISRLRHRQFGILVTTGYVDLQAYREIKEDQHPIIVISGVDIVKILRDNNCSSLSQVQAWLTQNFILEK